jgi:UDP-N-acetylglucosamine 1-carboxyvinyltransferase
MRVFKITGGRLLKGTVRTTPNKNSSLKFVPASLVSKKKVILKNMPRSVAVETMVSGIVHMGAKISWLDETTLEVNCANINTSVIPAEICGKERSTLLMLAPLAIRLGKSSMAMPGGCDLDSRSASTLFNGIEKLGFKVNFFDGIYTVEAPKELKNSTVYLREASVTGTDNLIIAASALPGIKTKIINAACEPHVQDLCKLMISMGADIKGIGSNILTITGASEFKEAEGVVGPDHIDTGGLIVAAAIIGDGVKITNCSVKDLDPILSRFEFMNIKIEILDKETIFVPGDQNLHISKTLEGGIPKISDQPWPNYPVDLIPQAIVLAMFSQGQICINSNMFEHQLTDLYKQLKKMHAPIKAIHANKYLVGRASRPRQMKAAKCNSPSIIQATHALFLTMLATNGVSYLNNPDIMLRRYAYLIQQFCDLGANIEVLEV